jgi:peptide/nickel transport system substrate-binding protein
LLNDLAETYRSNSDATVWTVVIRNDVKFSDGEPLTAKDVAYTFNTAAQAGGLTDVSMLQEARATGDYEVQFTLKHAASTFVNRLATLGIVPQAKHNASYAQNPVGSGPYKMVRWDKGQQLIVEANPVYYGTQPQIHKITFVFTTEDEANLAAARAGRAHVASVAQSFGKQQVANMRLVQVKSVDNRGIMFPTQPASIGKTTPQGTPIGNDVTNDLAMRRAINVAIDRQALVRGILEGFGSPAFAIANGTPWDQPEAEIRDADPDQARQILAQGGWQMGADGLLEKGGTKADFQVLYFSNDSTRQSLALSVTDMLRPLGIKTTPRGVSREEMTSLRHSNAVVYGWGSHDPTEIYNIYHSKMAGIGSYNAGFYESALTDTKLDRAMGAPGEAEAIDFWKAAQWDGSHGVTAKGDAVWAWLVNLDHVYFVSNCLDIGKPQVEPHGHGWPITANIAGWKWTCN